jgi:hypothetical protein
MGIRLKINLKPSLEQHYVWRKPCLCLSQAAMAKMRIVATRTLGSWVRTLLEAGGGYRMSLTFKWWLLLLMWQKWINGVNTITTGHLRKGVKPAAETSVYQIPQTIYNVEHSVSILICKRCCEKTVFISIPFAFPALSYPSGKSMFCIHQLAWMRPVVII